MRILHQLIKKIGAIHGKRLGELVDRQEEPTLFKLVLNSIDKKLSIFTGCGSEYINPEWELMQNMMFEALGAGFADNMLDVIKYGRYALKAARYKAIPYVSEYREAVLTNLPSPHKTHRFFIAEDFRKENITTEEINTKVKQIFFGVKEKNAYQAQYQQRTHLRDIANNA